MKELVEKIVLITLSTILIVLLFVPKAPSEKHIYLGTTIGDPGSYTELAREIYGYQGHLYVHLVGNGGNYEGALYLINVFHSVKQVTMVVDGSVYSAHAMLAVEGNDVVIPQKGIFLYHLMSTTNMVEAICISQPPGVDRGVNAIDKCIEDENKITNDYNAEVLKETAGILTAEEQALMVQGRDIILSMDEMRNRLKGKK
jgi:hypothetical protein